GKVFFAGEGLQICAHFGNDRLRDLHIYAIHLAPVHSGEPIEFAPQIELRGIATRSFALRPWTQRLRLRIYLRLHRAQMLATAGHKPRSCPGIHGRFPSPDPIQTTTLAASYHAGFWRSRPYWP